jgi:hypothetical protein
MTERRRFTRVQFDSRCRLYRDGRAHDARLVDVSMRGLLIERPDGWRGRRGDEQEVEVRLAEAGPAIRAVARVAHVQPDAVGFEVLTMDLDSATHLRRLLELNTGDPQRVHRELTAMLER